MGPTKDILVCFALAEEARPFERLLARNAPVNVLVTGIGRHNAERSVRRTLDSTHPRLVLTCGFAGGLDPALAHGTVLFEADTVTEASPATGALVGGLTAAGARAGRFYCATRIAVTACEKRVLRASTGSAAVEMESEAIRSVCQRMGIPCLTVRVISDEAGEDLPLDFNAFMKADEGLDVTRILWAVMRSPGLIGPLRQLQQRSQAAAERLAAVLLAALELDAGRGPVS